MLYEIDFLPVGDGERSGDAICLRYSLDEGSTWMVGAIDGGTQESGESLCAHIKKYYHTDVVDFAVCTHPDQDHASGLSHVIENLTVKKVLMHLPWDYAKYIMDRVTDKRITEEGLRKKLIEGHPNAYNVFRLARAKNIPVFHAFSDLANHEIPCMTLAAPSTGSYLDQLIKFRSIADITEAGAESGFVKAVTEAAKKAVNWITESWDKENLVDPEDDATSGENNSSTILLFDFDGKKKLLTSDAGVPALNEAASFLERKGVNTRDLAFIQAPHHGSKRNVGPTILNRIIGETLPEGSNSEITVFISATKQENPKHPNKRVVNAFIRRGGKVVATQGFTIHHFSQGMPDRGWERATPLPFYTEVEEDD